MAGDAPEFRPGSLTFVVPAYNEEARLGTLLLDRLIDYAAHQDYMAEVIVVDDGSADRTAEIAREAAERAPERVRVRLLQHEHNRGKGAAVRTGALAATGDVVLYLDSDGATPPEETPKLLELLADGADVAAGTRVHALGDMRASQPAFRRLGGRLFAIARRRLLLSDVEDTQCGFKAFRREAAQAVFPLQRLDGWAFDAEILYLAQRLGFTVAQASVEWRHVEGSTFRLGLGSALREVRDLLRIRWMHRGVRHQ